MTMKTLADLNAHVYERDWDCYRLRREWRVVRYGWSGSHTHIITIEIVVIERGEHKSGTFKVGDIFSSAPECNSQRGQHGGIPLMNPRWDLRDVTCAKCKRIYRLEAQ